MAQLRPFQAWLSEHNVDVLVVTFQTLDFARRYAQQWQIPWPVVCDQNRELYRHYGMRRAGWWTVMGPQSWWGYIRLLLAGRKLELPTDDIRQLGGDVLIDPDGIVRFHHVTANPIDRPDVAKMLERRAASNAHS